MAFKFNEIFIINLNLSKKGRMCVLGGILLLFLIFLRIPYTTTFIDSYIFDYFFGTAKYIYYLNCLFLLLNYFYD